MRSISKALGLVVALLAVPAMAQTIDGGQGIACNVDTDCGNICGWVCSFDVTPHICVPAVTQAKAGQSTSEGWCESNSGCACPGQTCSAPYCTPLAFAGNGSTPLCVCDSDCPTAGQHCDPVLEMCARQATTSCNYDGECGCGCFCLSGACECTGLIPQTCSTSADCGPACEGYSCVGGACVHDEASCVDHGGGTSGGAASGGSTGGAASGGSTSGGASSGGSTGAVASSSGSTGGGSSGGASSGGGSSGGACGQVGATCTSTDEMTACCSQYCKSGVCACNIPNHSYACVTTADCCSGTCTNSVCVAPESTSGGTGGNGGGSSSGGAGGGTSGGASSSSGGGSGGACVAPGQACVADGGSAAGNCCGTELCNAGVCSNNAGGGCGCGTGASGTEGLALLALGLVALVRRKRV